MKLGVVVFNLGGPESLDEVQPFLYRLFSDPEIIRIRSNLLRKAVAYTIATLRKRKSQGYYRQIGGGSPLRRITEEQARALSADLQAAGLDAEVFAGMCTWRPFLAETLERVEAYRPDRLVILPLFPHFSVTTTGSGFKTLEGLIAGRPGLRSVDIRWIRSWPAHPTYIEAFVGMIRRELDLFSDPEEVRILFSAHSVPESYIREGDPYLEHTEQTVERIMDRLGRRYAHRLSFQSRIGPVRWLEPSTNEVIQELGRQGVGRILVVPVSFVSEHIETLYELDILYRKLAADTGIAEFRRVPALNTDPTFVRALRELVESAIAD